MIVWQIAKQTLEARYPRQYLYWDRTGSIANEVLKNFPTGTVRRADTDRAIITVEELGLHLAYCPTYANIVMDYDEGHGNKFHEFSSLFIDIVFKSLQPRTIERAGNRFNYTFSHESKEGTVSHIDSISHKMGFDKSQLSNESDPRLDFTTVDEFVFRMKSKLLGFRFEFSSVDVEYRVPKWAEEGKRIGSDRSISYNVMSDTDIYTLSSMEIAKFSPIDFSKSNQKMMETRILPCF